MSVNEAVPTENWLYDRQTNRKHQMLLILIAAWAPKHNHQFLLLHVVKKVLFIVTLFNLTYILSFCQNPSSKIFLWNETANHNMGTEFLCPHLSLNAVESSEPEDLSSPQLPLCMVDLLIFFIHILLLTLIFLS